MQNLQSREKYFWSQSIFRGMALNMEDIVTENNQNPAQQASKNQFPKTKIVN